MKDATQRYHLQLSDSGLGYNVSAGRNGIRPRLGDTVVISCDAVAFDGTTKLPQLSSDAHPLEGGPDVPRAAGGPADDDRRQPRHPRPAAGALLRARAVARGRLSRVRPLIFQVTLLDVVAGARAPKP